ncbi:MAG: outer membrane protein assembly factor BamA [Desulfobacteraceae bacterium]|nr:outer membrane protein assembly factor BamA [Desulfobacteraceae bacterium]MBC2755314.1 outer membrane protein assembly factor BamA [Desulfobacteraceae bacterium]
MKCDSCMQKCMGLMIVLWLIFLTTAVAGAEDAVLIKQVLVQDNQRIEDDAILRVTRAKAGDVYSEALLSEDLQAIYNMGWFDDVRVEAEKALDGNTVIFIVKEKPTIREIKFSGNVALDDEELNENVDISSGSILNIFKIRRNMKIIESLYKEKNYHNVKVLYKIEPLENSQANLEFEIEEGEKVRIKTITIDGNSAYDSKKLKKMMETSEKGFFSWLTSSGELNREELQQDIYQLTAFYQNNGYAEARVGEPEIEYRDEWIYILIKINEGPRFKMGHVDLKGDFITPKKELITNVMVDEEAYYNRDVIRRDVLTLTDIYADRGYAHADIFPEIGTDPESLTVDITFHITKNEPVYFERINIHGNTKTRDKVIRRELKIYEQELYSSNRLKRSVSDLFRMDFFEDVKVKPQRGSEEDQMILDIEVVEKPTGTFSFGGGYSAIDKLYVMASVSERNFLGRGQILEFAVQTGGTSRQYSFGFTEPWLFDIPLSAGIDAYKMERDYDDYDRDSYGGAVRFGYPLFDFTRGYIKYAYDVSNIDNISEAASPYILPGKSVESSVSLSAVYDSRNRQFNPSEGSRHSITLKYAGIGGNIGFTKVTAETGWYFPLFWGTVGVLHGEGGYIVENSGKYLPDYERFYLGGINSVRGFDWRAISPINDDGIKIGGTEFVQFNVEYVFPIIKESGLVGLFFYDAGNTWADEGTSYSGLRDSAGFGIRWFSPMGPLRLERGYILDPLPGEGSGRWEFSMGGSF